MGSRKGHGAAVMSVVEAVEALESISELDFGREIDQATAEEVQLQNHQVMLKAAKWVGKEGVEETTDLIRHTFQVVLQHLREFYPQASPKQDAQKEEGAKTLILLVGDVAQKLDRFTTLFKNSRAKSAKSLKEYQQLQDFYLTRVARKIDETVLGKWIFELSRGAFSQWISKGDSEERRTISAKHVFIDLESVKDDTEYELFFLRKEDGSRFFSPRLIRNIKLVCDFGVSIRGEKLSDPLADIRIWQDHALHIAAKEVLNRIKGMVDVYFRTIASAYRGELVAHLNQAMFALLLACNPENLLRNTPIKSCGEYFIDFQYFLRAALATREYQRAIVYPPKKSAKILAAAVELLHLLCFGLFAGIRGYQELSAAFEKVFQEAVQQQSFEHEKALKNAHTLWGAIASHQSALKKLSRQHPNGHLQKVLEILEEGQQQAFDPIVQFNLPYQVYSLHLSERKMTSLHMPAPIRQESIHKAVPIEEFKAFLRFLEKKAPAVHLLFNLQDRTSWKEHARSVALEGLMESYRSLCVVTLPKDTEFYHQEAPYHQDHQTHIFLGHFKEHLSDESCGFFFPEEVRKKLSSEWIGKLLEAVHTLFFGGVNVLGVNDRRDFIEIFYLFLQVKLLEWVHPETFSFTCKDGVDVGGVANAQLYAFLKLLQRDEFVRADVTHLDYMIYTSPLLIRERPVRQERLDRMVQALKRIESTKLEGGFSLFRERLLKEFGPLYKEEILLSSGLVPLI